MNIYNVLSIIGALVLYAVAPLTQAQCPQSCDATSENTVLGIGALPSGGGLGQVAVGYNALTSNTSGSGNVAIGDEALFNNTTGSSNVGVGSLAMWDNLGGNNNTAVGATALIGNAGNNNTAIGYQAMYDSTTGSNNTAIGVNAMATLGLNLGTGSNNTALGYQALGSYTTGGSNVASGYDALYFNTTGNFNTAAGRGALYHNTTASDNVATGYQALNSVKTSGGNTATGTQALQFDTGGGNTADGDQALNKNTVGVQNVATGSQALFGNTSGVFNTAVGGFALGNSQTGSSNIAIGYIAGSAVTSGSNNIDIGNTAANESSTIRIGTSGNQTNTYIAGINAVTVAGGIGVIVDSNGHLGTITSSARYKENIRAMDKASEAILSLQPVTFRYKKELDPEGVPQFGLVAEKVEKVDPGLVARDEQGKPYTVRYEAVNAMLLNEFLKEHRTVEEQQKQIDTLKTELNEQKTLIQKVSAQLELNRTAPQMVLNNH